MKDFNIKLYSLPETFKIAKDNDQYEQINNHISDLLEVYKDFILSEVSTDLSQLMNNENNTGWDKDDRHSKRIDILFQLQHKYQPRSDRFLS